MEMILSHVLLIAFFQPSLFYLLTSMDKSEKDLSVSLAQHFLSPGKTTGKSWGNIKANNTIKVIGNKLCGWGTDELWMGEMSTC